MKPEQKLMTGSGSLASASVEVTIVVLPFANLSRLSLTWRRKQRTREATTATLQAV